VKSSCSSNSLSNVNENKLHILARLGARFHEWNVILLHIHELLPPCGGQNPQQPNKQQKHKMQQNHNKQKSLLQKCT